MDHGLVDRMRETLTEIQEYRYRQALEFLEKHTYVLEDYDQLWDAVDEGFADAWRCREPTCEAQIEQDRKATLGCAPLQQELGMERHICCGQEAEDQTIFARAY